MRLIHARERRDGRLELHVAWAWDQLAMGVLHVGAGLWMTLPALAYFDLLPDGFADVFPAIGTTLGGASFALLLGPLALAIGAGFGYHWAVGAVEAVVLDRRKGELRTVRLTRGRLVRTRRPLHLLRRVEVRRTGDADVYGLAFEVRGEPPLVFPELADAAQVREGEAVAGLVRGFLVRRPAG